MCLVSVILPAYNAEKYIGAAVQSILDQTFANFELIIIDDASTDRTQSILQSFQDERIRIVKNDVNLKVVKSLNKAISLSKGEYIARMDADDISLPHRFETQLDYFKQHPEVDIVGSWVQVFDGADKVLVPYEKHEDIKASLLFVNNIIHPSIMMRKQSLLKHNLIYDESYINAEDYGLWVNAIDKLKFANVQQVLLKYRLHADNVSFFQQEIPADIKTMNFKAYEKIFRNMGLEYSADDLESHISFGLKRFNNLSQKSVTKAFEWLQHIVATNNQVNYFDRKALRNVVLHQVFHLAKKLRSQPSFYPLISKSLFNLYNVSDYFDFSRFIIKRKLFARKHLNFV